MSKACKKVISYFYKAPTESDSIELNSLLAKNIKDELIALKTEKSYELVLVELEELISGLNNNNILEEKEEADRLCSILQNLVSNLKDELNIYKIINFLKASENTPANFCDVINKLELTEEKKQTLIGNMEYYVSARLAIYNEKNKMLDNEIVNTITQFINILSLPITQNYKIMLETTLVNGIKTLDQQLHDFKILESDNTTCANDASIFVKPFWHLTK